MDNKMNYDKIEKTAKVRKKVTSTITYVLLAFWAVVVLVPF